MPTKLTLKAKDFICIYTSGLGAFLEPGATRAHAHARGAAQWGGERARRDAPLIAEGCKSSQERKEREGARPGPSACSRESGCQ